MKNALKHSIVKPAVAIGLLFGATASQAAIDVSPVISALGDAGTTVATVGAAALGVVVVVKVFRYIRSAF
ncbi:major capsid protein [Pseudomonas brassicacearum]|uniref:Uncharacterized protein n=1 Tax=Pseudomonas brassicacearum TaxID=930166 RepID=A0AAJ3KUQ4_9PSED|nr:major capsid protein [Pseudomonas brassicacearum]NUT79850.1 hypothetical protein [Pseudomonas brassicacearum]